MTGKIENTPRKLSETAPKNFATQKYYQKILQMPNQTCKAENSKSLTMQLIVALTETQNMLSGLAAQNMK
jgi:hypothetical protein